MAIGIDIDCKNLYTAKHRNPNALLIQGDATDLPLASESVDVLVGLEVLYYFPNHQAFMSEAFRVVRKGGSVLLTMPNPEREAFQASPFSSSLSHRSSVDELAC